MYSGEQAQEILERFNDKGWNLYKKDRPEIKDDDELIRRGAVSRLEVEASYVLLPAVQESNVPEKVRQALEILALKLNREMPTVIVSGERLPITGISFFPQDVKLHTPEGTYVRYSEVFDVIDTYTNASSK